MLFRSLTSPPFISRHAGIVSPHKASACGQSPAWTQPWLLLMIETVLDNSIRGGIKFDYTIFDENGARPLARGYTRHAFMDKAGKVVRPPEFFTELIRKHSVFTG